MSKEEVVIGKVIEHNVRHISFLESRVAHLICPIYMSSLSQQLLRSILGARFAYTQKTLCWIVLRIEARSQ